MTLTLWYYYINLKETVISSSCDICLSICLSIFVHFIICKEILVKYDIFGFLQTADAVYSACTCYCSRSKISVLYFKYHCVILKFSDSRGSLLLCSVDSFA